MKNRSRRRQALNLSGLLSAALFLGAGPACVVLEGERGPGLDDLACPDEACRAEIVGAVQDAESGSPIGSAEIVVGSCEGYTDNYGVFQLYNCEPGCFEAVVSHYDYAPTVIEVDIEAGHNTISPIALEPAP